MLDCRACISRCIRTIFADVLHDPHPFRLQRPSPRSRNVRYSTSLQRRSRSASFPLKSPCTKSSQQRNSLAVRRQTAQAISRTKALYRPPPPLPPVPSQRRRTDSGSLVSRLRQRIFKGTPKDFTVRRRKQWGRELLYLGDPLKLAENTIGLLRRGDYEKAYEMVQDASKRTSCTVSWNHLIDYDMSKGRVTHAMDKYNEVSGAMEILLSVLSLYR